MRYRKSVIISIIILLIWGGLATTYVGQTVVLTYWFPFKVFGVLGATFLCGFYA